MSCELRVASLRVWVGWCECSVGCPRARVIEDPGLGGPGDSAKPRRSLKADSGFDVSSDAEA